MIGLKPCPHCGGEVIYQKFNVTIPGRIICSCGAEMRQGKNQTAPELFEKWNARPTCHYLPDTECVGFDDDGEEFETGEASADYGTCMCDLCGYEMLGGGEGWFDEADGEHGGLILTPRFKHCPSCGAEVER